LFNRSWYNRANVERVMGFCTEEEYREFLRAVPEFERMLIRPGTVLVKYWFSVSDNVVNADNKKCARLNCIHHLLSMISYEDLTPEPIYLPPRHAEGGYVRPPITDQTFVPEIYITEDKNEKVQE
jgi:polyphosphate kinase